LRAWGNCSINSSKSFFRSRMEFSLLSPVGNPDELLVKAASFGAGLKRYHLPV
jgi:hypothetical protein